MRTQQQPPLDIKCVVHRAGRMIFWLIEGGKVVPVTFYFWPVRYIEPHRAEYRLDALPFADHGMDTAPAATAAGKRPIERLFRQPCFKGSQLDGFAACLQQGFNLLLCLVDHGADLRSFSR